MKTIIKTLLCVLFALTLCLPVALALGETTITVDENGLANWEPVPDAVAYEFALTDRDYCNDGFQTTTETSVQLISGRCLHLRAIYADGTTGNWSISDFYDSADGALPEQGAAPESFDPPTITVDENGLASWGPVPDAVAYEFAFTDRNYCNDGFRTTTDTSVQLISGRCLHLRAVFADGTTGTWSISDFYDGADGAPPEQDATPEIFDLPTITVDENGLASWEPMPDAVAYEFAYTDRFHNNNGFQTTTETSVQLMYGYCIHMRAIYADGTSGNWNVSDYYGVDGPLEIATDPEQETTAEVSGQLIHSEYTVTYEELLTYNLMENIDFDSVTQTEDGGVSFVAAAPHGGEMRFVGTAGVTVQPGAISFEPGSSIMALDSIGRICVYMPIVSDPGHEDNQFAFTGGYTFDGRTSVNSRDELFEVWPFSVMVRDAWTNNSYNGVHALDRQPNMIGIGAASSRYNIDAFTLSDLVVYYDETTYATPIAEMQLDPEVYRSYLEGDLYDPSKEVFDPENKIYDFHLLVRPLLSDLVDPSIFDIDRNYGKYLGVSVQGLAMSRITIGELKDAAGNVMDKATDGLSCGATLEIALDGGEFFDMPLPVYEQYKGAQTLHQLIPYKNTFSEGNVTALVIPMVWQDYPDMANDALMDQLRTAFGRVIDRDGNVTDYSDSEAIQASLSSYFDAVSNDKYHIDSFITDWCPMYYRFEDIQTTPVLNGFWKYEAFQWAKENYADIDWDRFDANGDGIADAVIFVGANPELSFYSPTSFGGATHNVPSYIPEHTDADQLPVLKDFVYMGSNMINAGNVLIHEYSHCFGLIDYYDVTYSGISAVGNFDMQSSNMGDWNAYSKYAVGWSEPHIVQDLAVGESVEFTIGAQSDTADAIVIPAAGTEFDGPFNEYIMVDLFTDSGVNRHDAAQYGMGGATGVRIYHVNARMERRMLVGEDGTEYPIGTVRFANDYSDIGKYHIELLQKGGDNTFTDLQNLRTELLPKDLFYAGDSFDAADYDEFLIDGRMDNGDEFGYIIDVTNITEKDGQPVATIRVTRK